jgi:hypothetical protein
MFGHPTTRAALERDAACYGAWLAYKVRCEE